MYIQDNYKVKEYFKGAIHINDSEYVFKTEMAIGNEVISMGYFEHCFKSLVDEIQSCYKRLLEIASDSGDKFKKKMNEANDHFDSEFEKLKSESNDFTKSFIEEKDEDDCDSYMVPHYEMPEPIHKIFDYEG